MTTMEIACEIFARLFFWTILTCALYGCWLDEIEDRQGRAVDAYLNGTHTRMYL